MVFGHQEVGHGAVLIGSGKKTGPFILEDTKNIRIFQSCIEWAWKKWILAFYFRPDDAENSHRWYCQCWDPELLCVNNLALWRKWSHNFTLWWFKLRRILKPHTHARRVVHSRSPLLMPTWTLTLCSHWWQPKHLSAAWKSDEARSAQFQRIRTTPDRMSALPQPFTTDVWLYLYSVLDQIVVKVQLECDFVEESWEY